MPWEKQFNIDDVLDKAMHAFWARGYEATSLQDLVDCTGVNRASLYSTYGDKRDLFLAALRRYDKTIRRAMLAELESRLSPRAAIRRLFEAFLDNPDSAKKYRGCFLTNTALELSAHDATVRKIVADSQAEIEAFFARLCAHARELGEAPATLDPAATARGLLAALLGLIVLSRSRPQPALLRSIVDEALKRLD